MPYATKAVPECIFNSIPIIYCTSTNYMELTHSLKASITTISRFPWAHIKVLGTIGHMLLAFYILVTAATISAIILEEPSILTFFSSYTLLQLGESTPSLSSHLHYLAIVVSTLALRVVKPLGYGLQLSCNPGERF